MSEPRIQKIIIHRVGNEADNEPLALSNTLLAIDNDLSTLLCDYLIGAFKSESSYHFSDSVDLNMNRVYSVVSECFDNPELFLGSSEKLASHLYNFSDDPHFKSSFLFVVYFVNYGIDRKADAIGIFRVDNKDLFLTVENDGQGYDLNAIKGVNMKKLDKGCLIINAEREAGFYVSVVDNSAKSDGGFWIDSFLCLSRREDNYFHTENAMILCRSFLAEELPKEYELNRAEQVSLLNKSIDYFKNNQKFETDKFSSNVISNPEAIKLFEDYRQKFAVEREIGLEDSFEMNQTAVKKNAKVFKSVIKLDKNFHIYVHGNRELIEQGKDNGGTFYKLYFSDES